MGRGKGEGMLILFSKYLYCVYSTQGLFLLLPACPSALNQPQLASLHPVLLPPIPSPQCGWRETPEQKSDPVTSLLETLTPCCP